MWYVVEDILIYLYVDLGFLVRVVGRWALIVLGGFLGLIVLLVVLDLVFPGTLYDVAYALGWLVGHIVKLFTG